MVHPVESLKLKIRDIGFSQNSNFLQFWKKFLHFGHCTKIMVSFVSILKNKCILRKSSCLLLCCSKHARLSSNLLKPTSCKGELSAINGQICDFVRLIFDRKFGHFATLFWPLFLMISSLGPSRVGSGKPKVPILEKMPQKLASKFTTMRERVWVRITLRRRNSSPFFGPRTLASILTPVLGPILGNFVSICKFEAFTTISTWNMWIFLVISRFVLSLKVGRRFVVWVSKWRRNSVEPRQLTAPKWG